MFPTNTLTQYPSGRYGFVGRVSVKLGWTNKDGSPLTDAQAKELSTMSNPAMKYKCRAFNTREEAEQALAELNQGL